MLENDIFKGYVSTMDSHMMYEISFPNYED